MHVFVESEKDDVNNISGFSAFRKGWCAKPFVYVGIFDDSVDDGVHNIPFFGFGG